MICDKLGSVTATTLKRTHPVFLQALTWVENMPVDIPDGRVDLRGDDLYVNVHQYATRVVESCQWESHRNTVDLQYCIAGGEIIEWAATGSLRSFNDYSGATDVEHWEGDRFATRIHMAPGIFAIFLPNELHRPQIIADNATSIRKLVVKIHAQLLNL
jgi:YhcH/YjgK/YiaL family protein